jgi:hypothetical protein
MGTENWIVPFFEKCTLKCTFFFFEICTLAHKMWNPEARQGFLQSNYFYNYEFMGETRGAAAAREEEGDKTELVEESRCVLDSLSWSWSRGSHCKAINSVRSPLPHSHGQRGTRCRHRAAWKEGNKGYPSDQIHCGGGARSIRYSESAEKS